MKKYFPDFIKHLLKKYGWFLVYYNKIFSHGKIKNRQFIRHIQNNHSDIHTLNVFSLDNEDGILLKLIFQTGLTNKNFIDIGAHDGLNSNCANLALHHGWRGTFIDADKKALQRGAYIYKKYFGANVNKFKFINKIISPDNTNLIISESLQEKNLDLLCMDLDGNDYFIWKALDCIRPGIVVVEAQAEKKGDLFIEEYKNEVEIYQQEVPKGASVRSMQMLGAEKGYKLVALNKSYYNLFFVRNDLSIHMPEINVDSINWIN